MAQFTKVHTVGILFVVEHGLAPDERGLERLETGYMPGLKFMNFTYEGGAVPG